MVLMMQGNRDFFNRLIYVILIGSIIAYSVTYLQKYCKYNFRFHDQLLHGS